MASIQQRFRQAQVLDNNNQHLCRVISAFVRTSWKISTNSGKIEGRNSQYETFKRPVLDTAKDRCKYQVRSQTTPHTSMIRESSLVVVEHRVPQHIVRRIGRNQRARGNVNVYVFSFLSVLTSAAASISACHTFLP